nr:uncharacterized protein LOC101238078 [Hydra vulgaris]
MYSLAIFFALCAFSYANIFNMSMDEINRAEYVLEGIDMAVDKLNSRHDRRENQYRLVLDSILKGNRHVTTGQLGNYYYIYVKMVETWCPNTDANDRKKVNECLTKEGGSVKECKFELHTMPWSPDKSKKVRVTHIFC